VDCLPQAIFWKDRQGAYLGCNEAFAHSAGLVSTQEIVGKTDFDLPWPRSEAEAYRKDDQEVISEKHKKLHIIEPLQHADGTRRWIDTTKVPLLSCDGSAYGVLGIFHDITAEILTQQTQARFRYSIQHAMDAVYWIDRDGRFSYVNEAACKSLGYDEATLLQLSLWDIDRGFPRAAWERNWVRFEEGRREGIYIETTHTRRDGSTFPVEVVANYMNFGGQALHVAFARDLTERKAAEQLTRTKQVAESLKEANAALQFSNQELESFSYSVSHDLRAPLRNITGFIDLLCKHEAGKSDPTSERYLNIIKAESKRMGDLIDDLLAFSRLGRAPLECTSVDLTQLFEVTRSSLANDLRERRIEWKLSPTPRVEGDPSLLRQVLSNLLDNAIKFTRGKDPARIDFGYLQDEANTRMATLYVRDNGAGFDPRHTDKLFGVFQRLHNQRDFEGTGIGLANVKRIIKRHGGEVWAEGRPGEGATFYFTVPKSQPGSGC